ncbi:hypothetical protein GN244_ATG13667 [Phytophthora infestans]|uniref:Uncharacterized protein n=1 Tax=Phytophthora infestans TaxID=4787 RepID=A0A833SXA8_PHYIN|nr:hypothetical protein GN244_ATG13667 [Phytophthora infestans]
MALLKILFTLFIVISSPTATTAGTSPSRAQGAVPVPTQPTRSLVSRSYASTSEVDIATPATAKSAVISTYRNWVGTWSMSQDTACYREAHIMDVCPSNYDRNEATNTCWTECPIEYPVECGMECIRQNDDCGIEVASKFSAVGITVLSSATFGAFGALEILGKKVWSAAGCSTLVMVTMRGILRYIRTMKAADPQASDRKILLLLFHSSIVVTDLPRTIAVCMKMRWMLSQALAHDDSIILSWQRFRAFLKEANFTEAAEKITKGEIKSLETAMKQNSSCGGELKSLVDRVWLTVNEYREENPAITDDEL